jgi:hypothetical protein
MSEHSFNINNFYNSCQKVFTLSGLWMRIYLGVGNEMRTIRGFEIMKTTMLCGSELKMMNFFSSALSLFL